MRTIVTFATMLVCIANPTPAFAQKNDPEKTLADAIKNAKPTSDVNVRIQAIMDLADFGIKAEPALADLLDALTAKNEDLRLNASITLAKIGKPAIAPVSKLLTDDDADLRFYAVWTIGSIGPDAKAATPTIIKLMSDKNDSVRRKAAFALGRLAGDPDKTISVLIDAFKDENDDVRQSAGEALSKFGKAAVPPLIALLKGENVKARLQAATSLGDVGSAAKDAVPVLKDLLLAKEEANAHHYANVLAKIGKPAVPALDAGLHDSRPNVRQASSQAMIQIGADAVPALVDALGDKNVEVRRLAAQTLWPMRIGDKSVVIALAYGLTDEDDSFKQTCINALANLGAQAKLASPKLKEALVDMNQNVRNQAYSILQQIGEDPRPTLRKGLESKNDKVRINTASLMVNFGVDANEATPVLLGALKHEDLGLKMQAAFTLAQRRVELDKVTPIFFEGLKHKSSGVRVQALQGISMMGNTQGAVAATVAQSLNDADPTVRQQTVYTLQNIRGTPETVVPVLDGIFKDGNADAKRVVLQIVWMYGVKGKDIIFTGLKDKDNTVRQQAIFSLQNIQGDISEAVPAIIELIKDKSLGQNRQQFVWLLARSGEKGAEPLGELLKSDDDNIRMQASQILRNMGVNAKKALPAIKEAVNDKNANVRMNAMICYAALSDNGAKYLVKQFGLEKDGTIRANLISAMIYSRDKNVALPLLKLAMADSHTQVRQVVVNSLTNFGQNSDEAFEAFKLALKDSDQSVRMHAGYIGHFYGQKAWEPLESALKSADSNQRVAIVQSMQSSRYARKEGVPALTECLKDGNLSVRIMACNVLANIGPDAKAALESLRSLANDPNQAVRSSASTAIRRIEANK